METEHEICKRYEREMARIAGLDRRFYLNPTPSRQERRDYVARQAQLEALRLRLYEDLADIRRLEGFRFFTFGSSL